MKLSHFGLKILVFEPGKGKGSSVPLTQMFDKGEKACLVERPWLVFPLIKEARFMKLLPIGPKILVFEPGKGKLSSLPLPQMLDKGGFLDQKTVACLSVDKESKFYEFVTYWTKITSV